MTNVKADVPPLYWPAAEIAMKLHDGTIPLVRAALVKARDDALEDAAKLVDIQADEVKKNHLLLDEEDVRSLARRVRAIKEAVK